MKSCKNAVIQYVSRFTFHGIRRFRPHKRPGLERTDSIFFEIGQDAVECLAACGTAPMMQANEDYYERLTEEKFDRILADLKQDGTCSLKTGPFMWPEAPKAQVKG